MITKERFIDYYRNTDVDAAGIFKAQQIARDCLEYLKEYLRPGLSQKDIHEKCARRMISHGAQRFWTHDDPALILFGDLTRYSAHESPVDLISGKTVGENDLITVDVAPVIGQGWGDMARSYVMEKGKIIHWQDCENQEIKDAMKMELLLHDQFRKNVDKNTTYGQLYEMSTALLLEHGYRNLDYHDNFGHSIENRPEDRVTICKGNDVPIAAYGKPLTYEPHIGKNGGSLGIKYENMYVFIDGRMEEI